MTDSSIGRQKTSTQSNAPAFSFGERTQSAGLSARNATNPGPGYYGPRARCTRARACGTRGCEDRSRGCGSPCTPAGSA